MKTMDVDLLSSLITPVDFEGEWGTWECPNCEEEHEDPEDIWMTTCRQCGVTISLSAVDNNGRRDAWTRG